MATSVSAGSCCVAVLNQQNRGTLQHHQRPPLINRDSQPPTKLCTVVEDGRVVVRPIDETPKQQ